MHTTRHRDGETYTLYVAVVEPVEPDSIYGPHFQPVWWIDELYP